MFNFSGVPEKLMYTPRVSSEGFSTASFEAPAHARTGEAVAFSSTSVATRGKIAAVMWDFGDGIPVIQPRASHTYDSPGDYRVTLLVWDGQGRGARSERLVRIAP
jgi:PKD repeat protein